MALDSAYISDSDHDHDHMADSDDSDCPCPTSGGCKLTAEDMDHLGDFNPYSSVDNNPAAKHQDRRNITALLDAYGSLSVKRLLDLLAANFTHRVLPESLGMPSRDKDAFASHAAGIFSVFEEFRMDPVEMFKVDDDAGPSRRETWVVRANMEGVPRGRNKGEWRNECVMIVRMDKEGKLVEEIQEFVDSAKAVEMMRQHAPKDFGGGGGTAPPRTAGRAPRGGVSAARYATSFCWFVFCVLVAKMGAHVLALLIFWGHPTLEMYRRAYFAGQVRQRR